MIIDNLIEQFPGFYSPIKDTNRFQNLTKTEILK